MAGDDDEMFMTRSFNVTPNRTAFNEDVYSPHRQKTQRNRIQKID